MSIHLERDINILFLKISNSSNRRHVFFISFYWNNLNIYSIKPYWSERLSCAKHGKRTVRVLIRTWSAQAYRETCNHLGFTEEKENQFYHTEQSSFHAEILLLTGNVLGFRRMKTSVQQHTKLMLKMVRKLVEIHLTEDSSGEMISNDKNLGVKSKRCF